jgi:hypothetical protein
VVRREEQPAGRLGAREHRDDVADPGHACLAGAVRPGAHRVLDAGLQTEVGQGGDETVDDAGVGVAARDVGPGRDALHVRERARGAELPHRGVESGGGGRLQGRDAPAREGEQQGGDHETGDETGSVLGRASRPGRAAGGPLG